MQSSSLSGRDINLHCTKLSSKDVFTKTNVVKKDVLHVQLKRSAKDTGIFDVYEDPEEENVIHQIQKAVKYNSGLSKHAPLRNCVVDKLSSAEEGLSETSSVAVTSFGVTENCSIITEQSFFNTDVRLSLSKDDANISDDFVEDNYLYMRSREVIIRAKPFYMSRQHELTEEMRGILVDWMSDIVVQYKMSQETLHISVSLIDRTLSKFKVERDRLQLVGTAAMMIAGKLEEVCPPELKDYAFLTDHTFTMDQIVQMERAILTELNCDIATPTAQWFCGLFMAMANADRVTIHAAQYLLDLSLMNTAFLAYRPSCVAAACFSLANMLLGNFDYWGRSLEKKTGIKATSLRDVLRLLHRSFCSAPLSNQTSFFSKYASIEKDEVSMLSPFELECHLIQ